jgi:hypothetical protein
VDDGNHAADTASTQAGPLPEPSLDRQLPDLGLNQSTGLSRRGRLSKPRIRSMRLNGPRLTLRFANRPAGATVVCRIRSRRTTREFHARVMTLSRRSGVFAIRLPPRWMNVTISYRKGGWAASPRLTVKKEPSRPIAQLRKRPLSTP